jgi:hypothetical protein
LGWDGNSFIMVSLAIYRLRCDYSSSFFDVVLYPINVSNGEVLAVGAPRGDSLFAASGHVRVFRLDSTSGTWMQLGSSIEGLNIGDQFGSSLAMSGNGMRIVVGSHHTFKSFDGSGQFFVFEHNELLGDWTPLGEVDAEGEGDQSGHSVSMDANGQRVAVVGTTKDSSGLATGHANVYALTLDANASQLWVKLGADLDGSSSDEKWARSIAISGDGMRVALGAYSNDADRGTAMNIGYVRVFEFDDTNMNWIQVGADINGIVAGDWFGFSVSLSFDGDILAIGAAGSTTYGLSSFVRTYELVEGAWFPMGSSVILGGGYSVDLSKDGKRLVTGSFRNSTDVQGSSGPGSFAVFEYQQGSGWVSVGEMIIGSTGSDMAGAAVAISSDGRRVVAASPGADVNGTAHVGRVDVYDYCDSSY